MIFAIRKYPVRCNLSGDYSFTVLAKENLFAQTSFLDMMLDSILIQIYHRLNWFWVGNSLTGLTHIHFVRPESRNFYFYQIEYADLNSIHNTIDPVHIVSCYVNRYTDWSVDACSDDVSNVATVQICFHNLWILTVVAPVKVPTMWNTNGSLEVLWKKWRETCNHTFVVIDNIWPLFKVSNAKC